jgi:hypothetical protein
LTWVSRFVKKHSSPDFRKFEGVEETIEVPPLAGSTVENPKEPFDIGIELESCR